MAQQSKPPRKLVLGAVAYDPKVVTIWDGFVRYFTTQRLPFDYVLYSNYESQVEAHVRGQIDIAWNSPLAWLETERLAERLNRHATALSMRDSDRDLTSIILVRSDSGIRELADLAGRIVAVGALDSPQATLIPLNFLANHDLIATKDFQVRRFDALIGKHGDHVGGERDAVRALVKGEVDAACILDANHLMFAREGTLAAGLTTVVGRTPPFDHCNFTVIDDSAVAPISTFRDVLLNMSYGDPDVRHLMDLEGLKQWMPGRTSGYAQLDEAATRFGAIDVFVDTLYERCS